MYIGLAFIVAIVCYLALYAIGVAISARRPINMRIYGIYNKVVPIAFFLLVLLAAY